MDSCEQAQEELVDFSWLAELYSTQFSCYSLGSQLRSNPLFHSTRRIGTPSKLYERNDGFLFSVLLVITDDWFEGKELN